MFIHTLRFNDESSAILDLSEYRTEEGWVSNVFVQNLVLERAAIVDEDTVTPEVLDDRFYVSVVLPEASAELRDMQECRMIRNWQDKSLVYTAPDWNNEAFSESILEPLPFGFGTPFPPPRVKASVTEAQPVAPSGQDEALRIAFLGIRANSQINMGSMRGDYRWHKDDAAEDFEMNGVKMDAQDFIEWAASQIS